MSQQKWKEDYIKVQEYLKEQNRGICCVNEAYPIVYYVNRISIKDYIGNSMIDDIVSESFERCYNKLEVLRGEVKHGYVLFQDMYFYHNTVKKTRNILNNKLKYISSIVSEIESPELIVIKKNNIDSEYCI